MTQLGHDSVTAANCSPSVPYIGGYVDGLYRWSDADWARFPNSHHITITVFGDVNAVCCDCESGDLTPQQAAQWAAKRIAMGARPLIYCSESVWGECKSACQAAGVNLDLVDWWIAGYPGSVGAGNLYSGAAGHQFVDIGPIDISCWADGFVPGAPIGSHPTSTQVSTPAQTSNSGVCNVNLPILKQGASGGAVKSLQTLLNTKAGQNLTVDGSFGPATSQAVRNVQAFFKAGVDGIVGAQTWGLLFL